MTLLPTGRSRVSKKCSGRSQSRTSWPPLVDGVPLVKAGTSKSNYELVWTQSMH